MQIKHIRDGSLRDLNTRAMGFLGACGYENRATALLEAIQVPEKGRFALAFTEWTASIARPSNEALFRASGFRVYEASGNDSKAVSQVLDTMIQTAGTERAIAIDISSMTRAWHGGIIRHLRSADWNHDLETFFAYVPATFRPPSVHVPPNEFVCPVDGFASLSLPDLPVAVIIGLGYERERALGLQQLLDPERTILMIPTGCEDDKYLPEVLRSNRQILGRTPTEFVFEYPLSEPSATFGLLSSVILGLRQSYRIVLASLGPKMFGIICFLLATKFKDVSVWRVSSGIHGEPRDARPNLDGLVVLDVTWEPGIGGDRSWIPKLHELAHVHP